MSHPTKLKLETLNPGCVQVGAGGGMKGGVNVYKALKDTHSMHKAWAHVAGKPYTEADLPRPINENKGKRGPEEEELHQNGYKNGKHHKNGIQRAVEMEAKIESDELGVVAL